MDSFSQLRTAPCCHGLGRANALHSSSQHYHCQIFLCLLVPFHRWRTMPAVCSCWGFSRTATAVVCLCWRVQGAHSAIFNLLNCSLAASGFTVGLLNCFHTATAFCMVGPRICLTYAASAFRHTGAETQEAARRVLPEPGKGGPGPDAGQNGGHPAGAGSGGTRSSVRVAGPG